MKLIVSVKAIPMLAVALLAPLVILAQTSAEQKTMTGIVSDAMCGATHSKTDPDVTSMKLSIPKPTSEMLPASAPATTATRPSNASTRW